MVDVAHAEDWLDRPVEPLAENAAAWAGFLAAFEAHPALFELLQENSLSMNVERSRLACHAVHRDMSRRAP
ncbi:hypothetical protein [Sorangium sp. So ce341]|uniref:hypothetical protein n=1 Tax=Sorangium sp. So ce341 TaxID=3133302 RepID=UPI003F5E5580